MSESRRPIRIANCSGFFGDRLSAAREMVDGGPIDVLTGDWLAELTMLILARQRMKHGAGSGYARTFLTQMTDVLGDCLARGIKVVSNAGGLDPAGCAAALRELADSAGLERVRIAWVEGDDLMPRVSELGDAGEQWVNLDTGESLRDAGIHPLTANAYLGGRAIADALAGGADVVITGRCTDAALVVGPAAWWHGWSWNTEDQVDLDRLAGAVVAGHVIECGAQATGGNYSFFEEVPELEHVGFPIAEVDHDGSSVITKHPGSGGLVSVGTVTAQLLYEIGAPEYANPDVTARFDTIRLTHEGRDRVRIAGVVGMKPPSRLKVAMNYLGGFRNSMTLVITGMNAEAKADLALRQVVGCSLAECESSTNPRELGAASSLGVDEVLVRWVRRGVADPSSVVEAQSLLQVAVKDSDPKRAGRAFTNRVVEAALGSYPGMFPTAHPGDASPYGVYWPTTVAAEAVHVSVHFDPEPDGAADLPRADYPEGSEAVAMFSPTHSDASPDDEGKIRRLEAYEGALHADERVELGRVVGARSGDKGGNANIGVWVRADGSDPDREAAAVRWLLDWMTPERVHSLLPELEAFPVEVFALANLGAVNIVIHGALGRGVADSDSLDPQAKGLGEQLRARLVDIPRDLLPRSEAPPA